MPQQPQRNEVGSEVTAVCPLAALVGGRGVKAVLTLILKKPLNLRMRFKRWKWGIYICTQGLNLGGYTGPHPAPKPLSSYAGREAREALQPREKMTNPPPPSPHHHLQPQ